MSKLSTTAISAENLQNFTVHRSKAAPGRVSVVIVIWNAKRYVVECLETLRTYCGQICHEVIVVDNASTDGAPEIVAREFPQFKLIRNSENYGFAKANNIAIAQATGDYICLVNSDVAFTEDAISPMLCYMDNHPEVGMIGPQMLGADRKVRRSTMRFPTLWNSFCRSLGLDLIFRKSRLFGGLVMADFDHKKTASVEVLTGWFVIVRRTAMEEIGLLDPQFFMYAEDLDWSYRFRRAGYQNIFFAETSAIHYGGSSSSSAPVRFKVEMYRANSIYWLKHHGRLGQQLFHATLAIHHAGRLVAFALRSLFAPVDRPNYLAKCRQSIACLRWTVRALMGKEDGAQV